MPIIKYKYIASQDDYNEDSIGSAGSLANRSNKSQGRGQELWEDEEDVLTGKNQSFNQIRKIGIGNF